MLAVYRQFWRINFLTLVEYRANFFMWAGFTLMYHGTALAALWVTLHQFPSMNGWDFKEMAVLYGLWLLGHAFHNNFFNIGEVPEMIREGRFDRFLVRPLDPLFQALTVPAQIWPDELIFAFVFFGFAANYAGLHLGALTLVFVAGVMLGGALIDFGIQLAIAALAFWVVRTDALKWVAMSLEQDFTRYPVSIYTRGVRLALTFVLPFAFMNYFPATFLLHKSETALSLAPQVGMLTPVVGALWFGAAYLFWRLAINRYQGTGS